MIKLSIIITAYNAEPYIHELLNCLEKQIDAYRKDVQTIVIDDGSEKPLKIDRPWVEFYSNDGNKGIPYSRNRGIELSKGKCIHIIDADDMVPDNYLEYILNMIDTREFDYIDLSWKSMPGGGAQCDFKLNSDNDFLPNPSSSTRVFSRDFIGETRFNLNKDAAEDEDFTRHLGIKHAKRICATEYMYFYRTYVPNSNSKLYFSGLRKTHKVGFYYNHVDSYDIVERVKKADEFHEPVVLTFKNDFPELEKYATVICPPQVTRVMEIYGEPNSYLQQIPMPIKAQLVLYSSNIGQIGGVETFIYNFCLNMAEKYDIVVLYDQMDDIQKTKLSTVAKCYKNNNTNVVYCDTLIMIRIKDTIPANIRYQKVIQTVHCVKQQDFKIPKGRDAVVCVSKASKDSFGTEADGAKVINNMSDFKWVEKALILVSATRTNASDKGKNEERMLHLAKLMKRNHIKFVWLYWGNNPIPNVPENLIYMGAEPDVKPYIKAADYLVQLSDQEAYSYSLLEALCVGTPVIVTPLSQNKDMRIKDGVNAHIVPFDFDDTYDVKKFLEIPKFIYNHDNSRLVRKWVDVIENTKPRSASFKNPVMVKVKITYKDLQLERLLNAGEVLQMESERADELVMKGLVERI